MISKQRQAGNEKLLKPRSVNGTTRKANIGIHLLLRLYLTCEALPKRVGNKEYTIRQAVSCKAEFDGLSCFNS